MSKLESPPSESSLETHHHATPSTTKLRTSKSGLVEPMEAKPPLKYTPSVTESYVMEHSSELNLDTVPTQEQGVDALSPTCVMWQNEELPIAQALKDTSASFAAHASKVAAFEPIADIRKSMAADPTICDKLAMDTKTLQGMFPGDTLSVSSRFGAIEPLLPPLRSTRLCTEGRNPETLFSLDYLIHDFGKMCQGIKPHSKTIFIDMGAIIAYHSGDSMSQPIVQLFDLYQRFGFKFDHIYGYEMRQVPAKENLDNIPEFMYDAYHWINVAVDPAPDSRYNPLSMLLSDDITEDDLVVVKLDIDHGPTENGFLKQMLEDERLSKKIDVLYFEQQILLYELTRGGDWRANFSWISVKESLDVFRKLREKGVAAHSWI